MSKKKQPIVTGPRKPPKRETEKRDKQAQQLVCPNCGLSEFMGPALKRDHHTHICGNCCVSSSPRVFKKRRESNPLRTVRDLCDWIYDATRGMTLPEYKGDTRMVPWTDKTLKQAVLWMYAMEYAESVGDLTRRDLASMFLTGVKPLTLREVQTDWLDGLHGENKPDDPRLEIATTLEAHFDVEDPYEYG